MVQHSTYFQPLFSISYRKKKIKIKLWKDRIVSHFICSYKNIVALVVASLNFKPAGFFDKGGFEKAGCVLNRRLGSDKWLRFSARVGKSSLSNFQTLAWSLKIEILAIYHWMGGQILSEIITKKICISLIFQYMMLHIFLDFGHPTSKIARKRNTQDVDYNSMQFSKPVFEKVTTFTTRGVVVSKGHIL